jgi:hypothetical protein
MKSIILLILTLSSTLAAQNLYLGDSHSYLYGLNAKNKRLGNIILDHFDQNLDYFAACGSRPSSWAQDDSFTSCGYTQFFENKFLTFYETETIIKNGKPKKVPVKYYFKKISETIGHKHYKNVILNFGDNMLLWNKQVSPWQTRDLKKENIDYRFKEINSLLTNIRFENCFWVGPTYNIPGSTYTKHDRHIDELYDIIEQAISPFGCQLLDSRTLPITKRGDGIHHGTEASRKWGESIVRELPTMN